MARRVSSAIWHFESFLAFAAEVLSVDSEGLCELSNGAELPASCLNFAVSVRKSQSMPSKRCNLNQGVLAGNFISGTGSKLFQNQARCNRNWREACNSKRRACNRNCLSSTCLALASYYALEGLGLRVQNIA